MATLAEAVFIESGFGVECELPRQGCALENPYVFDASARELKALAERGEVDIVSENSILVGHEMLINQLSFRRKA
jgi:hypothetical protein